MSTKNRKWTLTFIDGNGISRHTIDSSCTETEHRLMLRLLKAIYQMFNCCIFGVCVCAHTVFALRRKFISSICLFPVSTIRPSLDEHNFSECFFPSSFIASMHVTVHSRVTTRSSSSTLLRSVDSTQPISVLWTLFSSFRFLFCNRSRWVSEAYVFLLE